MFDLGLGTPKDRLQGQNWLDLSAKQGNADAQFYIADRITGDEGEAFDLYCKAAKQGHARAQDALKSFFPGERC